MLSKFLFFMKLAYCWSVLVKIRAIVIGHGWALNGPKKQTKNRKTKKATLGTTQAYSCEYSSISEDCKHYETTIDLTNKIELGAPWTGFIRGRLSTDKHLSSPLMITSLYWHMNVFVPVRSLLLVGSNFTTVMKLFDIQEPGISSLACRLGERVELGEKD